MKMLPPNAPGVYFFKNADNVILYIGKAVSLQNRIRSYFSNTTDWKVKALVDEHDSVDFIVTKNEPEALLLEAQLIKKHQPKYNVLLKSGQPFVYILFTNEPLSRMIVVRNKKRKGVYFGPFLHKRQARSVYHYLMRTFKLQLCKIKIEHGCLRYHIGTCAGNCRPHFDTERYLFHLQLAQEVLKNNHSLFLKKIKEKIKEYTTQLSYEHAKQLAVYLHDFKTIFETIKTRYSEHKFNKQLFAVATPTNTSVQFTNARSALQEILNTKKRIKTIDCFDISHFQSRSLSGACVRFTNGHPDKNFFRRFRIKTLQQQDDYAALQEIVSRRYKNKQDMPDLILIDGGKGQLNAVKVVVPDQFIVSLAKKEERLFGTNTAESILLNMHTEVGQLLIALRDYTHHFAISYHRKRQGMALKEQK